MQTFFRQYIFHLASGVLILILLVMLGMQIQSLRSLEQSSAATSRLAIRNYLFAVSTEVQEFYGKMARKTLSIPSDLLVKRDYAEIVNYFRQAQPNSVKLLFISNFNETEIPEILFYNPNQDFTQQVPTPQQMQAAEKATAPWGFPRRRVSGDSARLFVYEEDLENRIIYMPILDNAFRVTGVAGMIVDDVSFGKYLLPKMIWENLPRFFSRESQDDMIISVYDGSNREIFTTYPGRGQGDEFIRRWLFVFTDYYLKVQSRRVTPEQWARRNFILNLLTMILMTATLVVGIWFLVRNASRAVKLSQMKTDFVANVSHELRTPLSSIKVLAEFMRLGRTKDLETVQKYGQQIESEAQRLTRLIDKILNFSKIESGQKVYEFEKAYLGQLVSETINASELEFKQGGFELDYQVTPEPLPPVMMDREAITEALVNLLDNAVKYSGTSKYVRVQLGQENGFLAVAITDRGIGLRRDDQEKIFEKFYRVSNGLEVIS